MKTQMQAVFDVIKENPSISYKDIEDFNSYFKLGDNL